MRAVTSDSAPPTAPVTGPAAQPGRLASGLGFALLSALTFGTSGTLASGLLDTGWTAGSAVLARITLGAVVLAPFGFASLHRRWDLLWRNAGLVVAYGVLAVAAAQLCYFAAVSRMDVAPALMIEYTSPAAVVVWLWLRRGQRPGAVTLAGAAVAALGLVLVLDVLSGGGLDPVGVLWALGAMLGCATHFLIAADEDNGLPPMALASGGLVVGATLLGLAGLVGLLPLHASRAATTYADRSFPWWAPVLALGLVSAALSYTAGIEASRRLGSRLSSFVALLEVVAAVGFAWLLLAQLPAPVQLAGGALILVGVVVVKLGEPAVADATPTAVPVD